MIHSFIVLFLPFFPGLRFLLGPNQDIFIKSSRLFQHFDWYEFSAILLGAKQLEFSEFHRSKFLGSAGSRRMENVESYSPTPASHLAHPATKPLGTGLFSWLRRQTLRHCWWLSDRYRSYRPLSLGWCPPQAIWPSPGQKLCVGFRFSSPDGGKIHGHQMKSCNNHTDISYSL